MDAENYHQLGLKLKKQRKYADAVSNFTKAIELTPSNSSLYMDRASALYEMKDLSQVLNDLDMVIGLNPQLVRAYTFRAHINERLGDDLAAIDDYTNAIHIDPRFAPHYLSRGNIYQSLGRTLDMIDDYYDAVSLDNSQLYYVWGSSFAVKIKKKLEIIDEIISASPSHPESYALRTHLRFQADDYHGGIEDLTQALHLQPDDARFLVLRSTIFYGLDDWPNAIADLNKAIAIDPEFANAYVARATNRLKLGKKQQALADFERAVQLEPKLASELSSLIKRLQSNTSINESMIDLQTVDLARRPEQIVLAGDALPLYLQNLIRDALQSVRSHSSHQFLPLLRRSFYDSLSSNAQLARRIEGWVAVIAARQVLPVFQNALPEEYSPQELIALAEDLLKGQTNRKVAQARISEEHSIAGNLWNYADEMVSAQAMFAGWAAHRAAQEAYDSDNLGSQGQTMLGDGKWIDQELASHGRGDAASCAAMAVSYDDEEKCDSQKLLAFWEWWLIEAIPAAWKAANI